ncbi:MAG: adenosylcobinamide-phosphate synthase CbiB [Pseudomonadota bacterium]
MSALALMLWAWAFEVALGWPDWLYKLIRHPVVWVGALVSFFERTLNQTIWSHQQRYIAGTISTLLCIAITFAVATFVSTLLPNTAWGHAVEALMASSLIASRSLHAHVAAVAQPLATGDLEHARQAVSMIVGRDPALLDEAGIARASLESLAENASDGIIAPLFWGAIFGLPGLAAYKAVNTLDSMIGHRNDRYAAFGGFAARLDDVANFIPARVTGGLIAMASLSPSAFKVIYRDAPHHRSPNAGWPEAAMAGALGVRLSGPRQYGDHMSDEPWLYGEARDPHGADMMAGLRLYRRAMALAAVGLALMAWGVQP